MRCQLIFLIESELKEFIDNANILMGTLGHKVLIKFNEPKAPSEPNNITSDDLLLRLKRKSGIVNILPCTIKARVSWHWNLRHQSREDSPQRSETLCLSAFTAVLFLTP